MEIVTMFSFCSKGGFVPVKDDDIGWINKIKWMNQYGVGIDFEINMIWLRCGLDLYWPNKKAESSEIVSGKSPEELSVPYIGEASDV
jgi:hypothetical protein